MVTDRSPGKNKPASHLEKRECRIAYRLAPLQAQVKSNVRTGMASGSTPGRADGEVAHAIRIVTIADPNRPTVSELSDGRIIGYGRFN